MNAIDLLKADHAKVKDILSQLSDSTERALKKREIGRASCRERVF